MNIYETNIFTGIPEIDTQILLELRAPDLYNVCLVNQYSAELCYNDKTLRERFRLIKLFKNKKAIYRSSMRVHDAPRPY